MRGVFTTFFLSLTTVMSVAGAQDFAGFTAAEVRVFPEAPAFPEQDGSTLSPSLMLQPEYRHEWNNRNDRLTIIPFLRLDADDDERTHADFREFNWLHIGPDWDLQIGLGKVFWGVAESRHLVDIINQTDRVEDIDEEDKLGQPMINLNLIRDWGRVSLFVLPGFRERTFPDAEGRLRPALPVDTDRAAFESAAEQWHVDLAARWSHSIANWDIGIAHFWGTGREPRLVPDFSDPGNPVLVPHYDIINQTSLDVQFTKESWLWKLEAMTRSGQGDRFAALVGGFEYTLYGILGTNADLGILAEYLYDGREAGAPVTPFDDDIFLGTRLVLNDIHGTELLAGAIVDRDSQASLIIVEGSRRLTNRWSLELDARIFTNIPSSDALFGLSRDDVVQIRLKRFF